MIYVGIDTGTHTGYAVWDSTSKELKECTSLMIHQAMERVRRLHGEYGRDLLVRIEDPRQRTWFGTERMSRDEERKRLQGVGSVKRDASIWEDFLSDAGVRFQMVAPKNNTTKISAEYFKSITKWTARTNEHGRDAAMLVVGF